MKVDEILRIELPRCKASARRQATKRIGQVWLQVRQVVESDQPVPSMQADSACSAPGGSLGGSRQRRSWLLRLHSSRRVQ